ncbi:hypothetical protein [Pseudoalteromonas sp. Z9A5]|uniref:hypothetical protein n=1 Tax=Pseudoalteromonas sp. Z9A5 TaxID=2686355 RepID=UPI001409634B|nr:hypothetical protein [Pseudoalteromonas sp. Z9A5]
MQCNKSGTAIFIDFLIRGFSATACLFISILALWILRGIESGIPVGTLRGDDPIWIASFLSCWLVIPAIAAYVADILKGRRARVTTYSVFAVMQSITLYFWVSYMAKQPHSEVSSSILPMLVWLSIPLAALYYPAFFYGLNKNKMRIKVVIITLIIIFFWFV